MKVELTLLKVGVNVNLNKILRGLKKGYKKEKAAAFCFVCSETKRYCFGFDLNQKREPMFYLVWVGPRCQGSSE